MKKVIAFDLDGTLAPSKSPMEDKMSKLLGQLIGKYQVCVISGGKYGQFEKQLLANVHIESELLNHLHLMPTCGTQYYRFDNVVDEWKQMYAENIPEKDKKRIKNAIKKAITDLSYVEDKVYGETIEDRGSQITFSALGQDIVEHLGPKGVELKENWDLTGKKKLKLRDYIAELVPDYEIRAGGSTSIDITRPGIDKAYGMNKLKAELSVNDSDILFIGDRLQEGGNDYPVKAMGIDSIEVQDWQETALIVQALIYTV